MVSKSVKAKRRRNKRELEARISKAVERMREDYYMMIYDYDKYLRMLHARRS